MRIGLCEDDPTQLAYVNDLIVKWAQNKKYHIQTHLYQSGEEILFEHTDCFPFELLILDIHMDKINGMELARKVRIIDKELSILFLTGQPEYVYEGYEVGAFRYLLKPIKEEQLFNSLDEIYDKCIKQVNKCYIFQYSGETIKLWFKDIMYIESYGHYIKLFTTNKIYEWKYSLGKIMKELEDKQFCSPHRSYLLNLCYVETIEKTECTLTTGIKIPISRSNYHNFHLSFMEYYR